MAFRFEITVGACAVSHADALRMWLAGWAGDDVGSQLEADGLLDSEDWSPTTEARVLLGARPCPGWRDDTMGPSL